MAIPESQLETWAHQGSVKQSSDTYSTIRRVLETIGNPYPSQNYEVFLQGSYGNDTNIYRESDVDVVIRFDAIYYYDISNLTSEETSTFRASHPAANYVYKDFKDSVFKVLQSCFGIEAKSGKRAFKIDPNGNRRKTDVLVATQYRRYQKFSITSESYELGICFFDISGIQIANYPKQHSLNCTMKHQTTNGWFKPTVRILKNLRGKLVENGSFSAEIAPSYFLEGLLYNVPKEKFGGTYSDTLVNAINWILEADRDKFVCANEQYYLLRDSPMTWTKGNCDLFLTELKRLWASW